jgi:nucleoside-diphosphate-sugar epimerase
MADTLLTGCPGWLGSQLAEALSSGTNTFNKNPSRKLRCLVLPSLLKDLPPQPNIEYVPGNLATNEGVAQAVEGIKTIFHLAGIIHPKKISDFYAINTTGTKNLVEAAQNAGVEHFIHMSSNSVAGFNKSRQELFTEDTPTDPYMHYGKSKLQAEEEVIAASAKGLKYTIFRGCWFYGPHQPARQTRFFKMIQKGNPIIFGDGHNLRSMSYIDNTVQAFLLAEKNPNAYNQIFWLADKRPYETIEIYQTVADILGATLTPRYLPGMISWGCRNADRLIQSSGLYIQDIHVAGEMNMDIACSVEKAERLLGYNPAIELKEGMRRSIEWCRNNGQL